MSYSNVGLVWDTKSFADYLASIPSLDWAKSVTVHHTAYPDLAMRPQGFTIQHMRNLQSYYQNDMGWKAGPHLFTDDDEILGLSPLTAPGTHAKSFNSSSIGVEMLGSYDKGADDPHSGRGQKVLNTSFHCVAALLTKLRLQPNDDTILFHRDDPRTSKTCPGSAIDKDWFIANVQKVMGGQEPKPEKEIDREAILERIGSIEWQCKKVREELG